MLVGDSRILPVVDVQLQQDADAMCTSWPGSLLLYTALILAGAEVRHVKAGSLQGRQAAGCWHSAVLWLQRGLGAAAPRFRQLGGKGRLEGVPEPSKSQGRGQLIAAYLSQLF